ncbi:hypothetical protein QL285_037848 [Trifolium repens]|nr:hypothetical protein QL285_037848 [Trifolium repens]
MEKPAHLFLHCVRIFVSVVVLCWLYFCLLFGFVFCCFDECTKCASFDFVVRVEGFVYSSSLLVLHPFLCINSMNELAASLRQREG